MKLLKNKIFISIVATIFILITIIFVAMAMIEVAKNENNNVKCYWTTKGLFCMSELGSDNK